MVRILLSEIPIQIENVEFKNIDKEIMRAAMIAELDAINLYEQMADLTDDEDIKEVLLDIAREEKIHVAMFETVLLQVDDEFLKVYSDYSLARSRD